MLPTLMGRIQTRIFATLVIGGLWSLIVGLFLPGVEGAPQSAVYKAVYGLLIIIIASTATAEHAASASAGSSSTTV